GPERASMQGRLPGTIATPVLRRHSSIPTLFGPGHRTPQLTTRCNGSCHWEDTIGSAGFGHGRSSLTPTTWFITGDGHCAWWCLNRAMAYSLSLTLTPCGAAEGSRRSPRLLSTCRPIHHAGCTPCQCC